MLAAGTAALLLVAIAVGVLMLLSSTGEEANQSQNAASPSSETGTDETTTAPVVSAPALPLDAAERVVFNMYIEKSYRDVDGAWAYLSQRKQQEEGSKEQWAEEEQINTFTYTYFTQYPNAEASGEEARVSFQVRETLVGRARLVTGTWVCVNEGGEWKLDRLEDERTETLY